MIALRTKLFFLTNHLGLVNFSPSLDPNMDFKHLFHRTVKIEITLDFD
jgi:hypothetical protein